MARWGMRWYNPVTLEAENRLEPATDDEVRDILAARPEAMNEYRRHRALGSIPYALIQTGVHFQQVDLNDPNRPS